MAEPYSPLGLADIPSELLLAIVYDATQDARRVAIFLDSFSQAPGMDWLAVKPASLPADFLRRLGAALRLWHWEMHGILIHREYGLPSADTAVRDTILALTDPAAAERIDPVPRQVFLLSVERFAWNARAELDADVTLGDVAEDTVLEALADFLWAHRPL